ncbi:MAG TPA: hypothetical protein VGX70_18825 [Gemmataceae bacterium]|jgi:hypothetical protein|nr:hypothetical protein [Gemmataceae bacterium]
MLQTLTVCALLAMGTTLGQAQEDRKENEVLVELTVAPMTAPKPALKYQLLPELKEMNPGNPIQGYLKCFMEQQNFFFNPESVQNREKWGEMPLKDLPLKELQGYRGSGALRQADYAARLDTPDWQVLLKAKSDGTRLLLPDVQQMRMLAVALRVRFRVEVAEGRFDDAIASAKTMFALGRHFEAHPSLIADLVGFAITGIAMHSLEEMIQQPACPNLYWALTGLPRPFVDIHKGLDADRMIWDPEFALLDSTAPMSEQLLSKVIARLRETIIGLVKPEELKNAGSWFQARVTDASHVQAARQRLIEAGIDAKLVKKFPPLQVVLLDEKREFEVWRDDTMKWMTLPYWQGEPGYLASQPPNQGGLEALLGDLVTSVFKVRGAQARVDRRIAMLRTVEALRLYAADHDGKLPAKLIDLPVPVPDDPITGKPFEYKMDGSTAELHGAPPKAFATNSAFNLRYVISFKK